MRWVKWLYPGMNIKRWLLLFAAGLIFSALGIGLFFRYKLIHIIEAFLNQLLYFTNNPLSDNASIIFGAFLLIIGIAFMAIATRKSIFSIVRSLAPGNNEHILDKIFAKSRLAKGPAITVIGGGTGLSVLLRGIKEITNNCTAVVTCADDGGSSGRIREAFGIIPPGDCRNCLIALADTEPLMEKLMQYRFKGGTELSGHSFGNLFITAMSDIVGNVEGALNETSKILKVRGKVIPSTLQPVELVAKLRDGRTIFGESVISKAKGQIINIRAIPDGITATQSAVHTILNADVVILGPGSLYTSVIANLLIDDIKQALLQTKATVIYICNVMTQPGETTGFTAYDHVHTLLQYLDNTNIIDYVVVNNQFDLHPELLAKYALENSAPVENDSNRINDLGIEVIQANMVSQNDLIRHNPSRLARTLIRLIYNLHIASPMNSLFEYFFIKNIMKKFKSTKE